MRREIYYLLAIDNRNILVGEHIFLILSSFSMKHSVSAPVLLLAAVSFSGRISSSGGRMFGVSAFAPSAHTGSCFSSKRHAHALYMSSTMGNEQQQQSMAKMDVSLVLVDDTSENVDKNKNTKRKDELINIGIISIIILTVLTNLLTVDLASGLTRGWTAAEMAYRIPLDDWHRYEGMLHTLPIETKALTSATVYAIGDIIAQRTDGTSVGELDRGRTVRSLLAGLIGHGPLSHLWYNVSENLFDNVLHLTAWWSFVPKVVVDQSVWGPIWNNTYLLLLGLMKRESLDTIVGDMKRTTIPLVISGLKLWPLAHCVTYGLVPVENRLLWVDAVEIIWVTILASQAAGSGSEEGEKSESNKLKRPKPDDKR